MTLAIGSATRGPTVETEARRLAQRLQAASDDALLGDRIIAFTAQPHGYGFAAYGADSAAARASAPQTLDNHRIAGGIVMTLSVNPPVILGAAGGQSLEAVLESGDERWRVVYDGMIARATRKTGGA